MNEDQLIQNLKNLSTQHRAFETVVNLYKEKLYWHIRKMVYSHQDADDLLQDTFLKAWKNIAHFRGDAKLFSWLYRIATNEVITFLNKKNKQHKIPGQLEDLMLEKLSSDPWFCGDELQLQLQRAILALPEKQRLVFNMKYFQDMKYHEMASILDTSEGALKASYHHAVKKITTAVKESV